MFHRTCYRVSSINYFIISFVTNRCIMPAWHSHINALVLVKCASSSPLSTQKYDRVSSLAPNTIRNCRNDDNGSGQRTNYTPTETEYIQQTESARCLHVQLAQASREKHVSWILNQKLLRIICCCSNCQTVLGVLHQIPKLLPFLAWHCTSPTHITSKNEP